MDTGRVAELYVPVATGGGGTVGSGYRVTPSTVLTAAHVVTGLPVWPDDEPVPADVGGPGVCWARMLGGAGWAPAVVAWRSQEADLAVLRLNGEHAALPGLDSSHRPRWGRVVGTEQVAVTAVGFPWAQERPDRVRDTEQLFGFIAPATSLKSGLRAVTVQSTPPVGRGAGSPWAGMSGAALFAGPYLVGVVVADPARFGSGRLAAAAVAPQLDDQELAGLLGADPGSLAGVGPRFRLAVTADLSVALAPPYRPATPRLGRQPARLLLPEYGIVPFAGRASDLQDLQDWCLDGQGIALRMITGSGGSGKTRLAAEACIRMAGQGWQAGFADDKAPGGQVQQEFDRPTLLIIDDADLKGPFLADLIRTAETWSQGPPVRLLLLSRHTTGWWDTLNQQTDHLAGELADDPLILREGELALADRAEQHALALASFSALIPGPADLGEQGPPLDDAAFASPLLVHMHALLATTGATLPTTGDQVRERILHAVLDRESKRWETSWEATFATSIPTGGPETRHQALTVATLLAPATRAAAAQAMTVIDELRPDAAAGARAAVASWLRNLYPGEAPPWIAPLRPDLLTEQLLATCPQLTELTTASYRQAPEQATAILAELTRAASRQPAQEAITQLLGTHLAELLDAAIDTPASGLADLLDLALTLCPQPAAAAALASRLPDRITSLAGLALTVAAQAAGHYRQLAATQPDTHTTAFAGALNSLAIRLGDVGQPEQALIAVEEAVTLRRQLATARPDAHTPDLAASLNNLAIRLGDVGRLEEALAASEESVSLRRQLAAAQPHTYTNLLATSLNNLSVRLSDVGRREEALAASEQAVTAYRQLATESPETFTPDLAGALITLAHLLGEVGRHEDALAAIEEAVAAYRQLTAAGPDRFNMELASALDVLSARLAEMGRREEALTAIQEAVAADRQLASVRPEAFTPKLAASLGNMSSRLSDVGRTEEALTATEETLAYFRQLAAARPEAFTPNLATSLFNMAHRLADVGRREEALTAIQEAVALYRRLATVRPEAFTPGLATSLINFSLWLSEMGRREGALAASEEAVAASRQLAAVRPAVFTHELATSLNGLSCRLADVGRREEALPVIEEAVAAYRQLAAARPAVFTADMARALIDLSSQLAIAGRGEQALSAIEEAVAAYRQLAAARPERHTEELAVSLNTLATRLREVGRAEEGLAASEEAVTAYRQLAAAQPAAFTRYLAGSLYNLSANLAAAQRIAEALSAIEQAVTAYRQLAADMPEEFSPHLAASLNNLAVRLADAGRREDALAAIEQAVSAYRQLTAASPDAHTAYLAGALTNQAYYLAALGHHADAGKAFGEAAALLSLLQAPTE